MRHRTLIGAITVGLLSATLAAQNPNEPPKGTGLVMGQVVDAIDGRPVPDVAVSLVLASKARADGNVNATAIVTDGEGHFVFRGVGAGSLMITGRRAGYVESQAGALRPDGPGQPIEINDGAKLGGVVLRMWRYGVIAGVVTDESGEPLPSVEVRAVQRVLVSGRWRLGTQYSFEHKVRTNDRGEYRISDLAPGSYAVVIDASSKSLAASTGAEADAWRTDPKFAAQYRTLNSAISDIGAMGMASPSSRRFQRGQMLLQVPTEALAPPRATSTAYQTVFYPGSPSAASAQAIAISAGEQRNGINFSLAPTVVVSVSGVVSGPGGAYLPLHLMRTDADAMTAAIDTAATITAADGAFTFLNVPPGSYLLRALSFPASTTTSTQVGNSVRMESISGAASQPTYWLSSSLTVGDTDVTNVSLSTSTGARIQGRVIFEGTGQPPSYPTLTPAPDNGRLLSRLSSESSVRMTSETFSTAQLPPGSYFLNSPAVLTAPRSTEPWTFTSITIGGRDLAGAPIPVDAKDVTDVAITYVHRSPASISGTVRAASAADLRRTEVMVFPASREQWTRQGMLALQMKQVRPSASGSYSVSELMNGDYLVVAVTDSPALDWRDPAFLATIAPSAAKVSVMGVAASRDLNAIRVTPPKGAPSINAAKPLVDDDSTSTERTNERPHGPMAFEHEQNQTPVRDGGQTGPSIGASRISGVVTEAGTASTPVRRVVVTLNSADPRVALTVVTDDEGRFVFDRLPAGRFNVRATKAGFVPVSYGATRPGRPGTPVVVAANAAVTIALPMTRTASISGTLRDGHGQPLRLVRVEAFQWDRNDDGSRALSSQSFETELTDDRGQYRIYNLMPGEYVIAASRANIGYSISLPQITADDWQSAQRELESRSASPTTSTPTAATTRPDVGYVQMFYPNTPSPERAEIVTVRSGEDRSGVDITSALVRLSRVRATITGPDGQKPAAAQGRLSAAISVPGLSRINLEAGSMFPITDGELVINGVPPGDYVLHAGGSSTPPAPPTTSSMGFTINTDRVIGLPMWGMLPITVSGDDVSVSMQLQPSLSVLGRIVFEGSTPAPAFPTLRPSMQGPRKGGASLSTLFMPAAANGEFTFDGLVPASYRLQLTPPRGWIVKSAVMNGRDAADVPVELTSDVKDAVITLTDQVPGLSGTLQSASGAPAVDYYVIVFPKDEAYWQAGSRRIVSTRPGTTGQFVVNALPPGDYLIAAVTDVRSGEWFDPEFLKPLVTASVAVSIGPGERKVQNLQIK